MYSQISVKTCQIKFDENPFSGSQVVPGVQSDSSFSKWVTEIWMCQHVFIIYNSYILQDL